MRSGPAPARAGGWLRRFARRRSFQVVAPLVVTSVIMALLPVAQSALTSSTSNTGNRHNAGSVVLGDNDATDTLTLFSLSNVKPGDTTTSCIQVTSTGTLAAAVGLYGTTNSGTLGGYLTLTITRGTISSGSFADCTNFTPDATAWAGAGAGVIYTGLLSAFPTTTGTAAADPRAATPELWSTNETHAYKFQLAVVDDNNAQSKAITQAFTWYATPYNSYDAAVLTDAPLAYYPLDEASGTTANDAVNGLNGTHAANVTPGVAGLLTNSSRAASYSATAPSRTTLPADNRFLLNGSFSIEFWYRQNGVNSSWDSVLATGTGGTVNSGFVIFVTTACGCLNFKRDGQDLPVAPASSVNGTAHHFVITYDEPAHTLRAYRDGVSTATTVITAYGDDTLASWHAPWLGDGDQRAIGTLDDVAFYTTALTQAQALNHYKARNW